MVHLSPAALAHLADLRRRLLRGVLVTCAAIVLFYLCKETLLRVLEAPLLRAAAQEAGQRPGPGHAVPLRGLMVTGLPELFFAYVRLCIWSGIFVSVPYWLWELWRFVSPGLYRHERRGIGPALVAVPLLFYCGGLFAYFVAIPAAIGFFLGFQQAGVFIQPTLQDYLGFLLGMGFAFGLTFNVPVVLLALMALGLLRRATLVRQRRLVIVLIFVAAAVLTPTPDPFNQLLVAVPMLVLFEVAVLLGRRFERG